MKFPVLAIALLFLAGCATRFVDPAAAKEHEMTRRYAFCLKQQLGPFGAFASPESRRKASESCQKVMEPNPPAT